ncbi:MAG: DnaJ domain-containing protein [Phyllobacteriaceae bacterium]|nr:DnaJ domain-containing protein [Phyllobacteriaceae bacterium]
MRDPYDILGVSRTADAKAVKAAYRRLAKKYHPDQNPDEPKAKERFAEIGQAYEIVGDDKKRAAFDRGEIGPDGKPKFAGFDGSGGGDPFAGFRRSGGGRGQAGFGAAGMEDILGEMFGSGFGGRGGRQTRGAPGADVSATLSVTLEEAASAARVTARFPDGRTLAVKLRDFVEDGTQIRLKGQGERNAFGVGDAILTVSLRKHAVFEAKGRDLYVDLPVPLVDAVLGAKLPVDTLSGRLALSIPVWSSSDKVFRLKGRGLPLKTGGHGDLFVRVRVMLPENDAELEALMKRRARV